MLLMKSIGLLFKNPESQEDSMSVADTLDTLDDLESATPDMDSRLMFIRLKEVTKELAIHNISFNDSRQAADVMIDFNLFRFCL